MKEIGLIMDKSQFFFTMDFNFQNVLTHALNNDSALSVDLIMNHIYSQKGGSMNYFAIMLNFESIINNQHGNCLDRFFRDDENSTT